MQEYNDMTCKNVKVIDPTGYSSWCPKILVKMKYCFTGYDAGCKPLVLE